ncbi:MAG TPA: CpsD/CapB family tyrosine-protein kinase [Aggregatilineales bacterium]|nr:CpsD/CapB family tyrosine-protein kinase [Aggregatilineales bacterium]
MPKLVTLQEPTSPAAEAFRTLRTNIQFAALEKPIKTLLVSSPAPDEGKSATVANLAVTLAQAGHKTILVDADLRRPSQHTLWGISNDSGLTSMMLSKKVGEPPLCGVEVDNLAVLPSGPIPPNPADLISAPRMNDIIEALADQAEFVLFDAPPILAVTDAILLGSKVDGLLLIVKAGATRRDHAQRAKDALQRANVRVLGVALTNAPRDASMASYYGTKP